jgi:LacI family transcriptional regulator
VLTGDDRPTAIVAGSHDILFGILRALRRLGVRVPQDVSLVTSDDVPTLEFTEPPMAVIAHSSRLLGERAAAVLLDMLDGQPPRVETVPTTFDPRASCGPPPSAA